MNRFAALLFVALASCNKPAPAPVAVNSPSTKRALPKYKGSATAGPLQADISVTEQGDYIVAFSSTSGEDIPAAAASNVVLKVAKMPLKLQIDDTGDNWIGKGPLAEQAHLEFAFHGKESSADIALNEVNAPLDYVCPMDSDVRSSKPGVCSRCGMKLVFGVADPDEYPLDLKITPAQFHPNQKVELTFTARDPKSNKTIQHFETVHEKLFHLFIVSSDLKYFVHEHPKFTPPNFQIMTSFPKPGMYRVLGDFYPSGGTPQLAPKTVFVPGKVDLSDALLTKDVQPQKGENTEVELVMEPVAAGANARLLLRLTPSDGLEKYLGAWAHMLAASDDLIDLLHEHPFNASHGQIEFDLTLPRVRMYRLWVQFQRKGVVNTVAFNVPVTAQP